jgi:Protein of unknown function (DUF3040)
MALSMDEQRILDGMERKLADDDPRLASRLAAFGQPRLSEMFGTGRARVAAVLISVALAAVVALMVYSMRPFPGSSGGQTHPGQRGSVVKSHSATPAAPPADARLSAPGPS